MRAIVQEKYGAIEHLQLRDVELPALRADQVLVRVRAASLHPDVWHVVAGRPYVLRLMGAGLWQPKNPIPGTDMAGTVESVGSGVSRFRPGDNVFGETISRHQWTNGGAEDFTRAGVRYDVIFDVPGNHSLSACSRALKADGNYVLIGHENFGASGKRLLGLFPVFIKLIVLSLFRKQLRRPGSSTPSRKDVMATLSDLLAAGKITPVIDRVYPLSDTREAFRHFVEDQPQGKVIIAIAET